MERNWLPAVVAAGVVVTGSIFDRAVETLLLSPDFSVQPEVIPPAPPVVVAKPVPPLELIPVGMP